MTSGNKIALSAGVALVIVVAVLITPRKTAAPAPSPIARLTPTAAPSPRPSPPPASASPLESPTPSAEPSASADLPDWEYRIDQVLRSNVNEMQTAGILLNMLPSLPEDGQIEAAEHISNLLPDKEYNRVLPLLTNPKLPETVLGVFMTDVMNRDDAVKLRAFLAVAKVPDHPFHEEALTDLQTFVDADYGTDWAKWSAAVEAYLAKPRAPEE